MALASPSKLCSSIRVHTTPIPASVTSTQQMSASPQVPTIRIVPGAPPPAPASKSAKKKRKAGGANKSSEQVDAPVVVPDAHAAALIDHAPSEGDVKEGSVASELVARADSAAPVSPGGAGEPKASPLVDMLQKRLKATGKKIVRMAIFDLCS